MLKVGLHAISKSTSIEIENQKFQGSFEEPFSSLLQRGVHCENSLQGHHYRAKSLYLLFLWKNQDHEPAGSQPKNTPVDENVTKNKKAGLTFQIKKPNQVFQKYYKVNTEKTDQLENQTRSLMLMWF